MKLPFEFGTKFIFRLVFPGAILALAFMPLVDCVLQVFGVPDNFEFVYPLALVVLGWLVVIADMHIYMLYEGRRYWPPFLRQYCIGRQQGRLNRLSGILNDLNADRRRYLEAGVEYALYPVNEDGDATVELPTRLGNVLQSFETHSKIKYGLDGVFYWPRLWVVLDKDLRDELDNSQALVDSTVYVSFALYVSAALALLYAAIEAVPLKIWYDLHLAERFEVPSDPGPAVLCLLALVCVMAAFAIYRISLPAHAQFGELFKAIFDQYRSKVEFDDVLGEVMRISGDPKIVAFSRSDKNKAIWRYLRWHLVRNETMKKNLNPREWRELGASGNPPSP